MLQSEKSYRSDEEDDCSSSSSSSYSTSSVERHQALHTNNSHQSQSGVRRRGGGRQAATRGDVESQQRNGRSRTRRNAVSRSDPSQQRCCSSFSTVVLSATFVVWLFVLLLKPGRQPTQQMTVQERIRLRTEDRANKQSFFQRVREGYRDIVELTSELTGAGEVRVAPPFTARKRRGRSGEADAPGCARPDWQLQSFPNCNEVHEVDLPNVMRRADTLFEDDGPVLGFIGSGLWRFVFVVDPRAVMEAPVVMKMMKSEHQVDKRNFDRHRRDALVMERTAGSPYVVDGYGFCGNTVLTEYLDSYLNNVIYEDDDSSSNGGGTHVTRETTEGRIRLALDVARGVAALHEVPGGPIVHADLQAKQFLITPDGTIKVNDFNRCRFMAHKNATGAKCPFYIPSAPGKMRSPEEYASEDLDEALDIYSVANIFYGIITGKPAWSEFTSSETKENVQRGVQPYIPDDLRKPGTADEALALLTQRAYTRDPQERITAPELVRELETLLDKVTKESSNG